MKQRPQHEFWVTNISRKRDVSLRDLDLTIRRGESRNLLDAKHYTYTLEQLQKSATTGSLKAKSNVVKVREVKPILAVTPGLYVAQMGRLVAPLRTKVEINIPQYEELDVGDEKDIEERFAAEEADIVDNDMQPALAVDAKYSKKADE